MKTNNVVRMPTSVLVGTYILQDDKPMPIRDPAKWGDWMEKNRKQSVRQDRFGKAVVSTVFLGFDHGCLSGSPILWETMIITEGDGPSYEEFQWRYTSKDHASETHAYICGLFASGKPAKWINKHLEELLGGAE